ncbi:MAG: hypothetical protein QGI60_00610 [archaeon]|jgi:hypothetical protein|nr:hypothetical protein [archaeon]
MDKKTHMVVGSSQVSLVRQAILEGFKLPNFGSKELIFNRRALFGPEVKNPQAEYGYNLVYTGGPPLWIANLYLDQIEKHYENFSGNIFLIVPDFRFRNQMFFEIGLDKSTELFADDKKVKEWYAHFEGAKPNIVKEFITPEKDKILYERNLACLDYIISKFGDRIKLIFWGLFAGEYSNKLRGKYTKNGVYKHPTWNYPELMKKYQDYVIDVSAVASETLEIPPKFFDNPNLQLARCNSLYQGDGRHFSIPEGIVFFDYLIHLGNAKGALEKTKKFMEENHESIEQNLEKIKELKLVAGKLVPKNN